MDSINWKEIKLLLSELPLKNSRVQKITQTSFNTLLWEMYRPDIGQWHMLVEVGTPYSRICKVRKYNYSKKQVKKLQRFEQFLRSNVESSVIKDFYQEKEDRLVNINIAKGDKNLTIVVRLYSGPGANVIITDSNKKILDLLFRRPNRKEISGQILSEPIERKNIKDFSIRYWEGTSFNEYIENELGKAEKEENIDKLIQKIEEQQKKELDKIQFSIDSLNIKIKQNEGYDSLKLTADLLSANAHKIKKGMKEITVIDGRNNEISISLNPMLNGGENVKAYYSKYSKAKKTIQNAEETIENLKREKKDISEKYSFALENPNYRTLSSLLEKNNLQDTKVNTVGIQCHSSGFLIFAGRNAKENDTLLRKYAKGNDIWLHTRDYAGGYVFIRTQKEKSVPLEVLLDAANLAVLFSKAKNSPRVDLYYTHVKYLRRAKNGKQGLVLPSQEKNLTISLDRSRTDRLLNNGDKQ